MALGLFQLFDLVRSENPSALDKIKLIEGDASELNLGITPEDRYLLQENVSVVFHAAASVRFDDPLAQAIATNTNSTREVVFLAKGMKKLQVIETKTKNHHSFPRIIVIR